MAGGSKRYSRNSSNGNFQSLPERGPGKCYNNKNEQRIK